MLRSDHRELRNRLPTLISQDRYLYWSTEQERWLVDVKALYADSVEKHNTVGFIFSETDIDCPGGKATWSYFNDDGVFKPAPEISVKMICRTNYGK